MSKLIRCDNPTCGKEATDELLRGWYHIENMSRYQVMGQIDIRDAHYCSPACIVTVFQPLAAGAPTQRLPAVTIATVECAGCGQTRPDPQDASVCPDCGCAARLVPMGAGA